jgi:hypothetical protein
VVGVPGDGDADADRAHELFLTHPERPPAPLGDAVPEVDRRALVHHVLGDDDELVASETGDGVRCADERGEPISHRLQDAVAHAVTERVVDHLEPVEVEEEHRQNASSTVLPADGMAQPVHQDRAVGQTRQGIGRCPALQHHVSSLALADVANRRYDERRVPSLDASRRRLDGDVVHQSCSMQ